MLPRLTRPKLIKMVKEKNEIDKGSGGTFNYIVQDMVKYWTMEVLALYGFEPELCEEVKTAASHLKNLLEYI